jgi:RimJ/RimL family protein N-acetyltransferase
VKVLLREVRTDDLEVLFEYQREPEGVAMAVFPARDWPAFLEHWTKKVLGNPANLVKAIEVDGEVAGWVNCFSQEGRRLVGYWLGQRFWGQGIATQSLELLLGCETERPLHAHVASSNLASRRVLEKCGFRTIAEETAADGVVEFLMQRDA